MDDEAITYRWVTDFNNESAGEIIRLVDSAVDDEGILGYAEPMSISSAEKFLRDLKKRVEAKESHLLLGKIHREPAFMVVMSVTGMTNCAHRAELSKGVVHPHYRGRKLVQIAFRALLERADALGVEQFVLDVREGSRAHRLWQIFGFKSFGVLEDYARFGNRSHRGHFMVQSTAALKKRLGGAGHV